MVVHLRRQYAVGQGCFHAGFVGEGSRLDETFADPGVRYVYDCGSLPKYYGARDGEIDRYQADCHRLPIDFLFLSHLHEDHVSGLERLCDPKNGCRVDTVIMPLINAIDRLICFARAVAATPDADREFQSALTVDPVRAVARFSPRQIILFRSEGGPAPSPGEAGEPLVDGPGDLPTDHFEGRTKRKGTHWRLIGRGRSQRVASNVASSDEDVAGNVQAVFEVDHACAIAIQPGSTPHRWILAPYVDVEVGRGRVKFIQKVSDLLGMTPADFEAKADDPDWLLVLVTSCKAELAAAYTAVANLNVTSLCLFSGADSRTDTIDWRATIGQLTWGQVLEASGSGWLGSGDADLKKLTRREALVSHYAAYLDRVRTLLLPHHGSDHNFHPDVLRAFNPQLSIAAADAFSNWTHPGSGVVQSVLSRGLPLWVVTSALASAVTEKITLHPKATVEI